jgi:hypothetical protein
VGRKTIFMRQEEEDSGEEQNDVVVLDDFGANRGMTVTTQDSFLPQ